MKSLRLFLTLSEKALAWLKHRTGSSFYEFDFAFDRFFRAIESSAGSVARNIASFLTWGFRLTIGFG